MPRGGVALLQHDQPRRNQITSAHYGVTDFIAGSINLPGVAPANFTFTMDSDDDSLLMIDGNVVISNPGAVL